MKTPAAPSPWLSITPEFSIRPPAAGRNPNEATPSAMPMAASPSVAMWPALVTSRSSPGEPERTTAARHHAEIVGPMSLYVSEIDGLMAVAKGRHSERVIARDHDDTPVRQVRVRDHPFQAVAPLAGDQNSPEIESGGVFAEHKHRGGSVAAGCHDPIVDRLR